MSELSAEIYVDSKKSVGALAKQVREIAGGDLDRTLVRGDAWTIDCESNPVARLDVQAVEGAGFMEYPLLIDISADGNRMALSEFLGLVSSIMLALAADGDRLTTVSDWDDELPGRAHLG